RHLLHRARAYYQANGALSAAGARCEWQDMARSSATSVRATDISVDGSRLQQRAQLETVHAGHAALQLGGLSFHLRDTAVAKSAAAESARVWSSERRSSV